MCIHCTCVVVVHACWLFIGDGCTCVLVVHVYYTCEGCTYRLCLIVGGLVTTLWQVFPTRSCLNRPTCLWRKCKYQQTFGLYIFYCLYNKQLDWTQDISSNNWLGFHPKTFNHYRLNKFFQISATSFFVWHRQISSAINIHCLELHNYLIYGPHFSIDQ